MSPNERSGRQLFAAAVVVLFNDKAMQQLAETDPKAAQQFLRTVNDTLCWANSELQWTDQIKNRIDSLSAEYLLAV